MKYEPPKFEPLTREELARERDRSMARRRGRIEELKKYRIPEQPRGPRNRKQRGLE